MQSVNTFPSTVSPFAVVTASELRRRPPRAPNFRAESRALSKLARVFCSSRESILQKLVDVAREVCKADSAGITLFETGKAEPVRRTLAAGLSPHLGAVWPVAFSPSGTLLASDAIQLLSRGQALAHIRACPAETEEALLIPLRLNDTPLGTLWVAAHDSARRFDTEDARLLASLGTFAAAGCEAHAEVEALEARIAEGSKAAQLAIAAEAKQYRFIAILGHELRGRLAPIKNAAELLKSATLDEPTRRRISEIVERQVGAMTQLTGDLLDVARARTGSVQLRRTHCSVADIIEHAVETVGPVLTARNHTLVVNAPAEALFIDADIVWLSQTLQNLLGNAAKYTNAGGRIKIAAHRDGDQVVITVSDNGIGIAPEDLARIFELYAQCGKPGAERSADGLGIGLYLARLLVEAHGGDIRAFSDGPGRGSEFVIRLPLKTR